MLTLIGLKPFYNARQTFRAQSLNIKSNDGLGLDKFRRKTDILRAIEWNCMTTNKSTK